ncbi:hypothetical protein BKA70DRAFT_1307332 [Coprinopsis sp. MPI-PUGE-AT-0042]|nr:hypothetical protein BKA70DRAFT_1307332 [Coprinopsis sp. MPI-PUGE-AT-0042]
MIQFACSVGVAAIAALLIGTRLLIRRREQQGADECSVTHVMTVLVDSGLPSMLVGMIGVGVRGGVPGVGSCWMHTLSLQN